MVFNPLHYLPLIERKIMAFDQAAPLQGWELPKAFGTLQRLLEARQGKTGTREYVQVLRLLERFEMDELHGAIKDALHKRTISFPSHGLQGQTAAKALPGSGCNQASGPVSGGAAASTAGPGCLPVPAPHQCGHNVCALASAGG